MFDASIKDLLESDAREWETHHFSAGQAYRDAVERTVSQMSIRADDRIDPHAIAREAFRSKDNHLKKTVPEAIVAIAMDVAKYQSFIDQAEIEEKTLLIEELKKEIVRLKAKTLLG